MRYRWDSEFDSSFILCTFLAGYAAALKSLRKTKWPICNVIGWCIAISVVCLRYVIVTFQLITINKPTFDSTKQFFCHMNLCKKFFSEEAETNFTDCPLECDNSHFDKTQTFSNFPCKYYIDILFRNKPKLKARFENLT